MTWSEIRSLLATVFVISFLGFANSEKPATPSGVQILKIYSTSILVGDKSEVNGTYIIKAIPNDTPGVTNCYGGDESSVLPFSVTKIESGSLLEARTKYDIGVCAGSIPTTTPSDPDTQTSMSDPFHFNAIQTGPRPPTNLRASSAKTEEIFVDWDDDDAFTSKPVIQYTVHYKPTTGSTDGEQSTQTEAVDEGNSANRDKFITITGLQSNTDYNISVVSISSDPKKTSDRSLSITGTTERPSIPTNFATDSLYSTSIVASWTMVDNLTYKAVAVSESITINNCDGGETVTAPTFTFTKTKDGTNMTARTPYNLALCAVNEHGGISNRADLSGVNTGPRPPTNLTASSTKSDEIFVEWNDDDAFTVHPVKQYTIYYESITGSPDGEQNVQTNAVADGNSANRDKFITITGLQSNTEYTISVVSITSNPKKTSDRSSSITKTTIPLTNFAVDSIFSTSIVTSWRAEKGFTYKAVAEPYNVNINNCDGGEAATPSSFTFTKTKDGTDIVARTPYNLALCVVNADGGKSDPIVLTNVNTGPPPPTNLTASSAKSDEIFLEWDDNDAFTAHPVIQYTVYYNPTTSSSDDEQSIQTDAVTESDSVNRDKFITITGLQSNTEYTISVVSITSKGNKMSDRSSSITGMTKPTNFAVDSIFSTSVVTSWRAEDGFTYKVVADPSSNTINNCDGIENAIISSFIFTKTRDGTDLAARTPYNLVLCAVDAHGGVSDPIVFPNAITGPPPPTNLRASSAKNDEIFVEWDDDDQSTTHPVIQYTVYYESTSGSPDSNQSIQTDAVTEGNSTNRAKFIIITELQSNTNYTISVVSITSNDTKTSDRSSSKTGITVPMKLSSPCSSNATNSSVNLRWIEVEEGPLHKTYTIACNSADDEKIRGGNDTEGTSLLVDDLMSNSEYNCRVSAVNEGGSGLQSPGTSVITYPGDPHFLTNSTTATETTISLQWEEVSEGSVAKTYTVRSRSGGEFVLKSDIDSNSTVITNLIPSTGYYFSVMASNVAGSSSPSAEEVFLTVPNETRDTTLSRVTTDSTTTLKIEWSPPDGGKEIEGYLVECFLWSGSYVDYKNVPHNDGTPHYSQTIGNLTPGETYDVSVKAYNTANTGKSQTRTSTTVPEIVVGLTPSQSTSNPTTRINLIWNTEGTADTIQVFYNSTTTGINKGPVYLPFLNKEGEIEVEPGNNYSISVRTSSKGVLSRVDESTKVEMNSEPHQVNISSVTQTANSLTVYWELPDGYVEGFIIKIFENSDPYKEYILSNTETSFSAYGLSPSTDYSVTLQSWITDIQGVPNYSTAPPPEIVITEPASLIWIVGVVLGLLAVVAIVVGGVYYYRRRKPFRHVDEFSSSSENSIPSTSTSRPVPSRKVKVNDFDAHVKMMLADSNMLFVKEYQEFISVGKDQSVDVASLPENIPKNRYKNILPYDHSRVKLSTKNNRTRSDYINANYIPGNNSQREYIAAQGPLATTKEDFWRLVWEQNSRIIVMVTQINEAGRAKCHLYWPTHITPLNMDGLIVTSTSESVSPDWTLREFDLSDGKEARTIKQFHYTAWPDHGVPQVTRTIVRFVWKVRQAINEEMRHDSGPTTIHCSAGVGRTGTFIAMDRLLQTLRTKSSSVDIYGIVYEMRMHRMCMVQTEKQYVLLHKMVQDIVNKLYDAYEEVDPIYANATDVEPVYENTAFQNEVSA